MSSLAASLALAVLALQVADKPHASDVDAACIPIAGDQTVVVSGTARDHGLEVPFELRIRPDRALRWWIGGPLERSTVVRAGRVWRREQGGPPVELDLRAREVALLDALAWTGSWASADGFVRVVEPPPSAPEPCRFRVRDGLLEARATFAPESSLIATLVVPGNREGRRWQYAWSESELGWYPRRATLRTDEGLEHVFAVESVRLAEATAPLEELDGATLAPRFGGTERELAVRRAPTGHLFVQPLVNGRDLGWFLFDSGAGATMLAADAIAALELERFGEARLTGFGPDVHETSFVRLESLQLGPLRIDDLVAMERVGPSMASRILGEPVAGVLGWDVFLRAVVTVDPTAGTVALDDPETFDDEGLDWQPLTLHWNVPYVSARFEGEREGLFCLDTGAGAKSVIFHADAVRRLGLLDGRETSAFQGGGAGGMVTMHRGELEWFEVAGARHAPAPAIFSGGDDGEADPYSLGFLGAGFLGDVRVVYDYGRKRVAFVER